MTDTGIIAGDHAMAAALRSWFGLGPVSTGVLIDLYRGTPLNARRGNLAWHICQLRHALDNEAIDYDPIQGYQLTESGRAECRAVLWQIGDELRRTA